MFSFVKSIFSVKKGEAKTLEKKPVPIFEGKYGFYPYNKEDYQKLKELYRYVLDQWKQSVHYGRMVRKKESNRHNNVERPEMCQTSVSWARMEMWFLKNEDWTMRQIQDQETGLWLTFKFAQEELQRQRSPKEIAYAYYQAKYPKEKAEDVEMPDLSSTTIDYLHKVLIREKT